MFNLIDLKNILIRVSEQDQNTLDNFLLNTQQGFDNGEYIQSVLTNIDDLTGQWYGTDQSEDIIESRKNTVIWVIRRFRLHDLARKITDEWGVKDFQNRVPSRRVMTTKMVNDLFFTLGRDARAGISFVVVFLNYYRMKDELDQIIHLLNDTFSDLQRRVASTKASGTLPIDPRMGLSIGKGPMTNVSPVIKVNWGTYVS